MKTVDACTAVILAGGNSNRMGQDKAGLIFAGEPLLNRAIQSTQPLFEKLLISVREPRKRLLFPQLCDSGEGGGPIMGIATALEQVDTPWVFAMACDMPFVSAEMIVALASRRAAQEIVVPVVDGMLQPLAAFYSKACLPLMRRQIEAGDRSLKRLIEQADATRIDGEELRSFDPELLSFMDLDCMQDVQRAEALMQRRMS